MLRRNLLMVCLMAAGAVAMSASQAAEEPAVAAGGPIPDGAPALGVVGIGVADLARSAAFYSAVLGLEMRKHYELGHIEEIVIGYPGAPGTTIVLMHWPGDTARRYDGNDVKLVFYVDDPAAVLERVRANGGKIDLEAQPLEVLNGAVVGMVRDPDNYVIELIGR